MMTSFEVPNNMIQKQVHGMYVEWTLPKPLSVDVDDYRDSPTFQYSGCSWFLRMYPKGYYSTGWMSLYVHTKNCYKAKIISFVLGIKTDDGSLITSQVTNSQFDKNSPSQGFKTFFKYGDKKIPSGSWTITCHVMSHQAMGLVPDAVFFKNINTLSRNFKELLISKDHCDVTIKVEDTEFQAHRAILATRSPVLAAAFQHDMSEKQTGVIIIEDCCPDAFKHFLEYLYTGRIEDYSWRIVYQLYIIADRYNEKDLKGFCLSYLMQNLAVENVCDVVALAEQHDESELLCAAQDFFGQNFSDIIYTAEWDRLLNEDCRFANKLLKHAAFTKDDAIKQLRKELEKS